jgi:hypothetical protein
MWEDVRGVVHEAAGHGCIEGPGDGLEPGGRAEELVCRLREFFGERIARGEAPVEDEIEREEWGSWI